MWKEEGRRRRVLGFYMNRDCGLVNHQLELELWMPGYKVCCTKGSAPFQGLLPGQAYSPPQPLRNVLRDNNQLPYGVHTSFSPRSLWPLGTGVFCSCHLMAVLELEIWTPRSTWAPLGTSNGFKEENSGVENPSVLLKSLLH